MERYAALLLGKKRCNVGRHLGGRDGLELVLKPMI
jgi:hypothetical protein